jgi:hypothetical protein
MNFFNSMVNFGKRGALGAGVGAAMGYYNTGDLSGVAGGAGAGAIMGSIGLPMAKSFLRDKVGLRGVGHLGTKGVGLGSRGLNRSSNFLANRLNAKGGFRNKALAYGSTYAARGAGGLGAASRYLGKKETWVNKYGGKALSGLGIASAASIGSSLISSNNGF